MKEKLVRDKVIERWQGEKPPYHTAKDYQEYWAHLRKKLGEEVQEFLASEDPRELADVLEIVYELGAYHRKSPEELEQMRQEKKETHGEFEQKIILQIEDKT